MKRAPRDILIAALAGAFLLAGLEEAPSQTNQPPPNSPLSDIQGRPDPTQDPRSAGAIGESRVREARQERRRDPPAAQHRPRNDGAPAGPESRDGAGPSASPLARRRSNDCKQASLRQAMSPPTVPGLWDNLSDACCSTPPAGVAAPNVPFPRGRSPWSRCCTAQTITRAGPSS